MKGFKSAQQGFFISIFLFFSIFIGELNCFANPQCAIVISKAAEGLHYDLMLGRELEYSLPENPIQKNKGIFLGLLRRLDGSFDDIAIFDPTLQRIALVPSPWITVTKAEFNSAVNLTHLFPVPRSVNQQGGTCAAFAIFNAFRQLAYRNIKGNGMIEQYFATEESRLRFQTRVHYDYYSDNTWTDAVSNITKEAGIAYYDIPTNSVEGFQAKLREYLGYGLPVLVRFDVAKTMSETPYTLFEYSKNATTDRRLWLPTKSGESLGGHMVIALGTFVDNHKEYVIILDSNWQAARIWEMKEFENLYTANIRATVLWQNGDQPPAPPISTPTLQ